MAAAAFPIYSNDMKIDNNFTTLIQDYLGRVDKSAADVQEGAELLLRINSRSTMYRRWLAMAVQRPGQILPKIEYELKKHLHYRLDGYTREQVARLDRDVTARMTSLMSETATSDDTPSGDAYKRGKRPDHDALPTKIQRLWDDNIVLWKQMKQWFEELKGMSDALPCDRYDLLQQLHSADTKYHRQMEAYDTYVITANDIADKTPAAVKTANAAEDAKAIGTARAYISANKKRLAAAIMSGDEVKTDQWRERIQQRIDVLMSHGAEMTSGEKTELASLGLTFETAGSTLGDFRPFDVEA